MRTLIEERRHLKSKLAEAAKEKSELRRQLATAREVRTELTRSRNECLVALARARDHIEAVEATTPSPAGRNLLSEIQALIHYHR